MKRIVVALSAIAMLAGGAVAQAADEPFRVRLSGIDLSTDSGAQEALGRIKEAATKYCRPITTGSRINDKADTAACIKELTESAVAQVKAPKVTALYNSSKQNS